MAWKINSSKREKIDRFEITIDSVTVPNGEEKKFSYISFAKGVCVLPISEGNRVICLKQYRHAIKNWQWELPAGMLEEDRTPLDMAKQELQEETGYSASEWIDLGSFYPSPGSTSEEIFLFAAKGLSKGEQNLESSEQIVLHEMQMEELMNLIANGEFQHGAGLAAIAKYLCKNNE
ncbi:NUDIX hydrolase [Neobacillus sp. PS3-34]|uniref:NUDIX hydrolase n=1 Tax=Neobacillus sp. PS3-34 TaxID=3070678 RepID=UPI0027E0382A|nr:NUDIX hydrolase [Neobacillus sp. PS3-34]WML46707.1 NUDIX hydrolase [Neobacillus sp. PS3-34]